MFIRNFGIIIILMVITSCSGPIKSIKIPHHDSIMDQNGGVVLVVDVCNQIDVVGEKDYCVINESKEVASALVKEIRSYLEQSGVQVRSEIIPLVCGALDSPQNLPTRVSEKVGATIYEASKPYGISEEINNDPEYLKALTNLSTYAFERGVISEMEDHAKINNRMDEFQRPDLIVQDDSFKEAVGLIKTRTNASSLLYVGIRGNKISGGKKVGQFAFSFSVGMATGLATAGLGTGYYMCLLPGRDRDGWSSIAGLINLESKSLTWQSYMDTGGNPLKVKDVANPKQTERLLKNLVYDEAPAF